MPRAAWLLLACLALGARAEAQDRPPEKPRPPQPAAPPADPEVVAEARAVRERGNCLLRAAQALQNARDAGTLEKARLMVGLCDAPKAVTETNPETKPTTTTTIENIAVEWPRCNAGDPLCNDTTTFDAAPIVRSVRRHRGGFSACGDQAKKRGHVRILLRLGEIDDRARPVAVQVEEDSLKEPRVTQCLTRSAARLTFPSHAAAARVRLTVKTPGR